MTKNVETYVAAPVNEYASEKQKMQEFESHAAYLAESFLKGVKDNPPTNLEDLERAGKKAGQFRIIKNAINSLVRNAH
jgi:hypothetical protein